MLAPRKIDWLLAALLGGSVVYFLLFYLTEPSRKDWFGFIDQSAYALMTEQIARLELTKEAFLFGVGYPLAGVPLEWLNLNQNPFVVFDLFAFTFAAYATYQIGTRLISRAVGAVAGFGLIFASPLIYYVVQPWNSSVSLVAVSALLLIASRPAGQRGLGYAALAGALVAWAFAARYVDVLWTLPLAAVAVSRESVRSSLRYWLVAGGTALLLALPVLGLHQAYFGSPLKTPYSRPGLAEQSLSSYQIKRIAPGAGALLVGTGAPDYHRGLLIQAFWVLAAIPGTYLVLRTPGRSRLVFGSLVAITIVGSLFYLSYRASEPDQFKNGTTHYFKLFAPGVAVLSAVTLVALYDRRPRKF